MELVEGVILMSGYRLTKKYHLYYCWSMWQIKRVFWRGSPIKNSIAGPELTDVTLSHCPTPLFAPKAERQKYFMSSINGNHGLPFWSFGPLSFLQANYTQSKFASGHRHHLEVQDRSCWTKYVLNNILRRKSETSFIKVLPNTNPHTGPQRKSKSWRQI